MSALEKLYEPEIEHTRLTSRVEFLMRLRRFLGTDTKLLNAFEKLPREAFVDAIYRMQAYEDTCWALKFGQTTTRPSVIARVLNELKIEPYHKILEIGTGSGYSAAILSAMGCKVHSVDKFATITNLAKTQVNEALIAAGFVDNLPSLYTADGLNGLPNFAPFDRIIIWGRVSEAPKRLKIQLMESGILSACIDVKNAAPHISIGNFQEGEWIETRISSEILPILTAKRAKIL